MYEKESRKEMEKFSTKKKIKPTKIKIYLLIYYISKTSWNKNQRINENVFVNTILDALFGIYINKNLNHHTDHFSFL